MKDLTKDLVIKRWGTQEQFYKELERFHKEHSNATAIRYDNETKLPLEAVYMFTPLQVAVEHLLLMEKIRELNLQQEPHGKDRNKR